MVYLPRWDILTQLVPTSENIYKIYRLSVEVVLFLGTLMVMSPEIDFFGRNWSPSPDRHTLSVRLCVPVESIYLPA